MNGTDIETRLQNIINADKLVSRQLAFKTKRLYKKLNYFENTTANSNQIYHEKQTQLMMAEKMLSKQREMLATLQETQESLQRQLPRLRKKVNDLKSQNTKSVPITDDDQFVYTKNALKHRLLRECTKITYYEMKTPNRTTYMGYMSAAGQLHPFEEKIPIDSNEKSNDEATVLWNQIKLGSQHLNEWNDLFFGDTSKHHTTL